MRNRIIERKYFTMGDCNINDDSLKGVCKSPTNEHVLELIRLLKLRFAHKWIIYSDIYVEPWESDHLDPVPNPSVANAWLNRWGYIENVTEERYIKLLSMYKENANNLLNKMKSESVMKYNDTPQTVEGEGDPYTTSITTSTNEVDPNELINRLKNIELKYADLMDDWVNEFAKLYGTSILYN